MRTLAREVGLSLAFLLLAAPCFADVIGSRPAGTASRDRSTVSRRMVGLGVHPQQAQRETAELSARDVEYFSSLPGRIVLAGAQDKSQGDMFSGESNATWYEIVGGTVFVLAVGALIVFAFVEARD